MLLCGLLDCKICFARSFQSHKFVKFWSYEKNNIDPILVRLKSNLSFWFKCEICHHDFNKRLSHLTDSNSWCPYCAGTLCQAENCSTCFQKSFATFQLVDSIVWSNRNNFKPFQLSRNSNIKFNFFCRICSHYFDKSLNKIKIIDTSFCPYCSAKTKICSEESCIFCHNNSFASYQSDKHKWSKKNGTLVPRQLTLFSHVKITMDCLTCDGEFKTCPATVSRGNGCPHCVNKTELKLYNWLISLNFKVLRQYQLVGQQNRPNFIDFVVNDNIAIELDGEQHFKQISNWPSPEFSRDRDITKMIKLKDLGLKHIRIFQQDVWNDKNEWKKKLLDAIQNCNTENVIYIASDLTLYDKHRYEYHRALGTKTNV